MVSSNLRYVISGGLGDAVSSLAKVYQHLHDNPADDTPTIIYVRDTIDESLVQDGKTISSAYIEWVKKLVEMQGFKFETITANQKEVYESYHRMYPEFVLLSPSQTYKYEIWEENRKMFYGRRPFETRVDVKDLPIPFKFVEDEDKTPIIGIQVRFGSEFPMKIQNRSCFTDLVELLEFIKAVQRFNYEQKNNGWQEFRICLIGETKLDLSPLKGTCELIINQSFETAYNAILNCAYFIGWNGFMTTLTAHACIPTLYMMGEAPNCQIEFDSTISETAQKCCYIVKTKDDVDTFFAKEASHDKILNGRQ